MPHSFSSEHGRHSDPKLFNVPNDSHVHNILSGEGDERPHLDVDLEALVDTWLGPEDAVAALSASEMPTETSSTVLSPVPAFSLGQFTVQGDQTCSSRRVSARRVEPVNNDAASLPTPLTLSKCARQTRLATCGTNHSPASGARGSPEMLPRLSTLPHIPS